MYSYWWSIAYAQADRLEGKVLGNEDAALAVFKGTEGTSTGSRSETEMNNLVSVVQQSSVDRGSDQEVRMMTAASTSRGQYCLMA